MDIGELSENPAIQKYVSDFVAHPLFLTVKDAFTNHTPSGDNANECSTSVAHGKNLGTRFVFNEMERVRKIQPQTNQPKPKGGRSQTDPDLRS